MNNLKYLNVLYLEDDEEVQRNISSTISHFTKEVYSASNVEEALQIYKKERIDFILSDIDMPDINGLEFIKIVRKNDSFIPIVVITAYKTESFLMEAVRLNLEEYIIKPISYNVIKSCLMACVNKLEELNRLEILFDNGAKYNLSTNIFTNYINENEILQYKEQLLLRLLIKNQNNVTYYSEIEGELWAEGSINKGSLKAFVRKLRQKIGHDSIITENEFGYRLAL